MYFTPKRLKLYLWALLALQVVICFGFRSSIRSGAIDFRVYYTAGYMLRSGQSAHIYDLRAEQLEQNQLIAPMPGTLAFLAPPFAALPFAPLSLLPYRSAFWVFLLVNLTLLVVTALLMRPNLSSLSARWPALPFLLFLTFLPAGLTLVMGQLSILMLLLFCVSFALLSNSRPALAGLALSLALIKFQATIPVVLLFLLWRQWRFLGGFFAGSCILTGLSLWIVGLRGLQAYLHSFAAVFSAAQTSLQSKAAAANPQRMPNLYGLFASLAHNSHVALILTAVASFLLLAWATTQRASLPLALLIAIQVSFYLFPCDLTLLLLPIGLLCNRLFAEGPALGPTPGPASPPQASRLLWLQNHRRQTLLCAIGVFLIGPALIEFITNNLIFLLALPILGLALCPLDWSTLTLPRASSAHPASEPQPTTI